MAFIRGNGKVALGGDFFQAGERFDSLKNRWVELRGIGFPGQKGGGEVVGDSFGEDEEIRSQTIEGGFEATANRIADDQSEKDRSGTDGDGESQKEVAARTSSGLLQEEAKRQREKAVSVKQMG